MYQALCLVYPSSCLGMKETAIIGNVESNSIDLVDKSGSGTSHHCEFKIKRTTYKECPSFEIITYNIKYNNTYYFRDKSYFSISVDDFNDVTVFGYYDPSTKRDVVDKMDVYYSIYRRQNPLVMVFTTRDGKKRHYWYSKLCSNQYVYHYLPTEHFPDIMLKSELASENQRVNKTLIFKLELGTNQNIRQDPLDTQLPITIGRGDKFKKVIFTPNSEMSEGGNPDGPFVLHNDSLFTLRPRGRGAKNEINGSYLTAINNREFSAVCVYYSKTGDVALMVEFIHGSEREQYIRMDKDGYCWEKGYVGYINEIDLEGKLRDIKSDSDSSDIITYILERKNSTGNPSPLHVSRYYSDSSFYLGSSNA